MNKKWEKKKKFVKLYLKSNKKCSTKIYASWQNGCSKYFGWWNN